MATKEIVRKIAVIFATDVVGYSKSIEKNEDQTPPPPPNYSILL